MEELELCQCCNKPKPFRYIVIGPENDPIHVCSDCLKAEWRDDWLRIFGSDDQDDPLDWRYDDIPDWPKDRYGMR